MHQFPGMVPALPPPMRHSGSSLPALPQAEIPHHGTDSFGIARDAVALPQLFAGERRPEVRVTLPEQFFDPASFFSGNAAIGGPAAPCVNQAPRAAITDFCFQTPYLPRG